MEKLNLVFGTVPAVLNDRNVFPTTRLVKKTAQSAPGRRSEEACPSLDLEALGQGMLDALALMEQPGYEPDAVDVTEEMLAQFLALSNAN